MQGEELNDKRWLDELLVHHVENSADDLLSNTIEGLYRHYDRKVVLLGNAIPNAQSRVYGILRIFCRFHCFIEHPLSEGCASIPIFLVLPTSGVWAR